MNLKLYFLGVGWFILSLVCSVINDIISKYTSLNLHGFEIVFLRFFFSTITLLPFIIYYKYELVKTSNFIIHIVRGILLFLGIISWTYGLSLVPISTASVINFTIPLFVLIMAVFFLSENIIWQRWLATILGFLGVMLTLKLHLQEYNPQTLILVVSTMFFAALDVLNKKFVVKESMINMLFYSAFFTAIFSAPLALIYWQNPTLFEMMLLIILGISANLILFFTLKAFSLVQATALVPYRYFELLLSTIAAYIIFNEIPEKSTIYGALIIIFSTLFIVYSED